VPTTGTNAPQCATCWSPEHWSRLLPLTGTIARHEPGPLPFPDEPGPLPGIGPGSEMNREQCLFWAGRKGGLSTSATDERIQNFYVTKLLPFSLKGDVRAWYDALPCGSIQSPQDMAISFVDKYFPAHMQHAALQRIYNFKQLQDEQIPKAWGRFLQFVEG
jgi:hypothetical protein